MIRHLVAAALLLSLAGAARADLDEASMKKVAESIKAGKRVMEVAGYPKDQVQIVAFQISGPSDVRYTIDVRAQLCFAQLAVGGAWQGTMNVVPCAALKKGYPLMAPIITWVD